MNYFCPQMKQTYCLYKIASSVLNDLDKVIAQLFNNLANNKYFNQFCESCKMVQKNNTYILLYKFKKELKCIDQIVLQFEYKDKNIDYDISVYCKQQVLDNKFYYPIANILNQSAKTFDSTDQELMQNLKKYFNDVFDKYFQIYKKNVNNGLFV